MTKIDNVRDLVDEVNDALGALRNLSSVHDSVAYNGVLDVLLWTNLPVLLVEVEKLRGQAARSDADHRTMDARATELETRLKVHRQRKWLILRELAEVSDASPEALGLAKLVADLLSLSGCADCPPGCRFCTVDADCGCSEHQEP